MNVITTEIQVFNRALGISLPATVLGKRLHHFRKERWCPNSESNQGHGDFQSPALPTELSGQRGALNRKGAQASTAFHEKNDKRQLTACFSRKKRKIGSNYVNAPP